MLPILNNDPRMFTDFRSASISYNDLKRKLQVKSDEEFKKYLTERRPVVKEGYGCGCAQCGLAKGK